MWRPHFGPPITPPYTLDHNFIARIYPTENSFVRKSPTKMFTNSRIESYPSPSRRGNFVWCIPQNCNIITHFTVLIFLPSYSVLNLYYFIDRRNTINQNVIRDGASY